MNEIQQFRPPSLTEAERNRALLAVSTLLEGFPQRWGDVAGAARAFLLAVDDLPIAMIEETAKAFLRGKVEGHDNAYPPTVAEFCAEARRQNSRRLAREAVPAKRPLQTREENTAERREKTAEGALWRERFARENPVAAARILGAGAGFGIRKKRKKKH